MATKIEESTLDLNNINLQLKLSAFLSDDLVSVFGKNLQIINAEMKLKILRIMNGIRQPCVAIIQPTTGSKTIPETE